jgi:hypothetical protein
VDLALQILSLPFQSVTFRSDLLQTTLGLLQIRAALGVGRSRQEDESSY